MQIKIRAWDSINKKMLSWEDLLGGREFRPKMREPEKYGLELMSYTGAKDGNGREIYDGDYIDIGDGELAQVYFEGGAIWAHSAYRTEYLSDWCGVKGVNVTGNIYENPEIEEGSE